MLLEKYKRCLELTERKESGLRYPYNCAMELYYHDVDGDVLILRADGGLDGSNAEAFMKKLETLVDAGARKLILDGTRLSYVSSYGIAILVRLHKKLAERGGDVKLAALDSRVSRLITLVGLQAVFDIYPNVDAAREAFRAP